MVLGELELSGRLRPARGVLAATAAGLRAGIRDFIVPSENAAEAAILAKGHFAAVSTLTEAVHALILRIETGAMPAVISAGKAAAALPDSPAPGDFADVRGQGRYKRALEIAAAGGHNLLVFGPPGAGKTMLARRVPSIMAPLTPDEAVEVTRLHSLAGYTGTEQGLRSSGLAGSALMTHPPFRATHHSASAEGILGGGKTIRPGEISLAHFGVLFLDEAPEFRANVLQSLREPLEDRVITISRADGPVPLPADFQLLLAANTCPCGKLGMRSPSPEEPDFGDRPDQNAQTCFCSPEEIRRYWRKFGAALLDRVELRTAVRSPGIQQMERSAEESSETIARRVLKAVEIQRARFKGSAVRRNAHISAGMIDRYCVLTGNGARAFHQAMEKLALSGRAYHSILRLGRTIADLEGKETIDSVHILEAVEHRRLGDDPYDIFSIDS
jgi:magnesium chelatase family protein